MRRLPLSRCARTLTSQAGQLRLHSGRKLERRRLGSRSHVIDAEIVVEPQIVRQIKVVQPLQRGSVGVAQGSNLQLVIDVIEKLSYPLVSDAMELAVMPVHPVVSHEVFSG